MQITTQCQLQYIFKKYICLFTMCLAFGLQAKAQASFLDQKVKVGKSATTLYDVLDELSTSYGIKFSYSNDLVPLQQNVKISHEEQSLKNLLDDLFKNTRIQYVPIEGQIVLQPAPKTDWDTNIQQVTISGFITDVVTGETLPGATITNGAAGISTNAYGFYSLRVPPGEHRLQVRYIGYEPQTLQLFQLKKDTTLSLQLKEISNELKEISVTAKKITGLQQANSISFQSADLQKLPRLMGEADAIKALQLMPGVQAGREGSSDLIVRGGGPDQNLILLDGTPVYNVSHLLGIFSVFNPDAIKRVDLIKGGFPAPYGGRLSSVVDIQLKEGNNQHFAGEGAIGLISSKLLLEGPVKNEKTSFMVAARRTYLDVLTGMFALISGEPMASYSFYDLNAKLNHTFSKKDRLFLSVYSGQDRFADTQEITSSNQTEKQKFRMRWGNTTTALRWNHVFSPRLFSNLTFIHSQYKFIQNTELNVIQDNLSTIRMVDYNSKIKDLGFKADFDYAAGSYHALRFGGSFTNHNFNPESVSLQADTISLTSDSFSNIPAQEFYTYFEDRLQFSKSWHASLGAHFSGFAVKDAFYKSLQPRLAMGYSFQNGVNIRASFATMAQYLHR